MTGGLNSGGVEEIKVEGRRGSMEGVGGSGLLQENP